MSLWNALSALCGSRKSTSRKEDNKREAEGERVEEKLGREEQDEREFWD